MRKNNTIEINGQRYDANTGNLLKGAGTATPAAPSAPSHRPAPATKPAFHTHGRKPAHHHQPHPLDKPHTLMRQAVKKPAPGLKRHLRAQGGADAPLKRLPFSSLTAKRSVQQLDKQRLLHAKHIAKSRMISHFSETTMAIYVPPKPAAGNPAAVQAVPSHPAGGRRKHPQTKAELLEHALEHARSHEELPPPRHSRAKRNASIGASVVLSGLLLGVIVSQNLSNVRLQVASAKAGFSASLPGYHPVGYKLGQLNYSSGVVAIQFHSNNGSGHYSITQQRSSWDSSTLRDSFVTPRDPDFQATAAAGRTIFLYGQGNATWVNGGIWYVIQSDGSLSNRQVLDLATSL